MKNLIEKLLIPFEVISHPASGWLHRSNSLQRKRKYKTGSYAIPSPDWFNIREVTKRKDDRRNPMP
ncbi:MAG: hypothetical protein ICV66_03040 [Chitinophagaceae bacterium]|nr:hypothetical protein [Chitinophagaceae bacterium]